MARLVIVEARDSAGVQVARLRFSGDTISVGRGPANDVVLDDPYVDGDHLEVTVPTEGAFVRIRDLGSRNGTKVDGVELTGGEREVPLGRPVVVGRTTLTFAEPSTEVAPAVPLPGGSDRLLAYERLPAWRLAATWVGVVSLGALVLEYEELGVEVFVAYAATFGLLLLLWAGAWTVGARLFRGAGRFREHLGFAALCGLVLAPVSVLSSLLTFALGGGAGSVLVGGVIGLAGMVVALFGHIDIVSQRGRAFKVATAGAAAVAGLGAAALVLQTSFVPAQTVEMSLHAVEPVPSSLTRSVSLETFLSRLAPIEAALEAAAEKEEGTR